jgi:hypothetical protein
MKRWLLLVALVLGGCSAWHGKTEPADAPVAKAKPAEPELVADGVPIERVPFKAGVSSVTVEKMARSAQCLGGKGAGLVTESGPIEVYKMQCDNGRVFMARCELRQCKAM